MGVQWIRELCIRRKISAEYGKSASVKRRNDLLLEPRIEKEAIGEKYQNFGISYKKNVDSYKNINVPTYTMEILKGIKKQIIVTLKK